MKKIESVTRKNIVLNRILNKADEELLFLKSNNRPSKNINLSSKYEPSSGKPLNWALYGDALVIGDKESWNKAFLNFCNKTLNIYGSRVDRKHLLKYFNDYRGRGSSSGESVEEVFNKKNNI